MMKYVRCVMSLKTDRRGVTAVEYGIMAALIATVLVAAITQLSGGLTAAFTNIAGILTNPAGNLGK